MGEEAHGLLADRSDGNVLPDVRSASKDYQSTTTVGEKIYLIKESSNGTIASISVQIFFKTTGKWITPIVLGTKPISSNGHSAVLLNEDRVMILKMGTSVDDCVWFLEVDTPFVKVQKKVVGTEVVAWSKGVRGDSPKPIVISGPSGVGKGTLIAKLMKDIPSTFGFSVSHTTRFPREKEINGVHYHFIERSTMEKDIQEGKFLEFASVHGNLYGTSIEAVDAVTDAGKRCILDIDVQGARSVRASSYEAIFVFVSPPSFEELEKRLREKGTETEEQVNKRLRNARTELEQSNSPGLFDHILVNGDLESCYEYLKRILGLDGNNGANCQPCTLRSENVIGTDRKFIVECTTSNEHAEGTSSLFEADISSLKGGAPGRTRGLNIYALNPSTDGENKI